MICINANVGLTILEVNFHSSCWLRQEFESELVVQKYLIILIKNTLSGEYLVFFCAIVCIIRVLLLHLHRIAN